MKIVINKNVEIDLENIKVLVNKLVEKNEILFMSKSEQPTNPGLVWMPYLLESSFEDIHVVPVIEEKEVYTKKIADAFIVNSEETKIMLEEVIAKLSENFLEDLEEAIASITLKTSEQ